MNAPEFAPCERHQSLQRMPFERALQIARECEDCYVEEDSPELQARIEAAL